MFFFDTTGGTYTPKHGVTTELKYDTGQCLFVFTDCAGVTWYFESDGQFLRMVSPGGETIEMTAYTPDGKIDTISRAITENGSTTTDSLKYEYDADGRISQITFRRTTNPTADIRRVKYAYYGSGEDHGSPGDLKTVTTQIKGGVTWEDHDVSYFRYYTSGQANGFVHGLKYALGPEAFERLKDDPAVSDPRTASNVKVSGAVGA